MEATYDIHDNSLRLRSSGKLDAETAARVKACKFRWAPRQECWLAKAWTPEREDLLMELCGEIDQEGTTPEERKKDRVERFKGYSQKRRADAEDARAGVDRIVGGIPLGQPILVGHHSERRARRDAKRIESGMRRTIGLFETSSYWTRRAQAAEGHAARMESNPVRWRRILKLESKLRGARRETEACETEIKIWSTASREQATLIANYGRLGALWSRLAKTDEDLELIRGEALKILASASKWHERWARHYECRIAYEREILGGWKPLKRAKPKNPPLLNYRAAGKIETDNQCNWSADERVMLLDQIEMTKSEYAAHHRDYKGTHTVWGKHHRVRILVQSGKWSAVFLVDSKEHPRPEKPSRVLEGRADSWPTLTKTAVALGGGAQAAVVDQLAQGIEELKGALEGGVQIAVADQLYPTPPELAARMAALAEIEEGDTVLEPSAGTGNLVQAALDAGAESVEAVEISPQLCRRLRARFAQDSVFVREGDFLEIDPDGENEDRFDVVLMNPPFGNAADITHIKRAMKRLKPEGWVVALCAGGPRQEKALKPLARHWERLPSGTFAGTAVAAVLLVIEQGKEDENA